MPKTGRKKADAVDVYVGQRIRTRRIMLGKTQTWLGEQLGVTFQQVQKQERGTNRISASTLQKIASSLNVDLTYFYDGAPSTSGVSASPTPAWFTDFMATRDGQAMAKAYQGIKSHGARRALLGVAQAIAAS